MTQADGPPSSFWLNGYSPYSTKDLRLESLYISCIIPAFISSALGSVLFSPSIMEIHIIHNNFFSSFCQPSKEELCQQQCIWRPEVRTRSSSMETENEKPHKQWCIRASLWMDELCFCSESDIIQLYKNVSQRQVQKEYMVQDFPPNAEFFEK